MPPDDKMLPKQMPSFIAMSRKPPPPLEADPPTACNRKTICLTANGQAKRPTYYPNWSRHQRCFESPDSRIYATVKSATTSIRKSSFAATLLRSKSTDTVTTLLAECSKKSKSDAPSTARTSRIQNSGLGNLSSRSHSKSPVAFGRSISKERTFAEEKKRLESTLPSGQVSFEASTNILRDPRLKSPDEVKRAMRSYALRPMHSRSKSVPRTQLAPKYPTNIQFSTAAVRCSSTPPRPSLSTLAEYAKILKTPSNKVHQRIFKTPPRSKTPGKKSDVEVIKKSTRNRLPNISKSSSTTSLVRTNSTFSVDSTQSKFVRPRSTLKTSQHLSPSDGLTVHKETAKVSRSASQPSSAINRRKAVSCKNISEAQHPKKRKYSIPHCGDAGPSHTAPKPLFSQQIHSADHFRNSRMPGRAAIAPPPKLVRKSVVCGRTSTRKSEPRKDKTYAEANDDRGISNHKSNRSSGIGEIEGDPFDTAAEGTEELIWRLEQQSGTEIAHRSAVSDIARPISPSPQRSPKEFLPTREVRVPQVEREVRSPSRRRIESLRPKSKADSIVRTSSLSSKDERSQRSGLYLCRELAHSAGSLDYPERHSPTCPYRVNSERFVDLNRFYNILERVGQLERATLAKTNVKPIRREGEKLDFDEWRQVRLQERAEKELNYLLEKLQRDQREKDLFFRPKDMEEVKWSESKDFGLRSKEKSVEDLRGRFERLIHEDYYSEPKQRNPDFIKDLYKPYWRSNTVADIASSLEIKYDPEVGTYSMQRKPQNSQESTQDGRPNSTLVGRLSREKIHKIRDQLFEVRSPESRHSARPDVSEEYVITVNADSAPGPEIKNLKIRCNSTLTEKDLMDSVRSRKMGLAKEECLKQSKQKPISFQRAQIFEAQGQINHKNIKIKQAHLPRFNSPPFLAQEIRSTKEIEERANIVFPQSGEIPVPPVPLPQKSLNEPDGNVRGTALLAEVVPTDEETAEDITKKIQYFEERKFDEPQTTVYHAREDSSPDEEEITRGKRGEMRMGSNVPNCNHKELTSSLTDLREIYGERQTSHLNFPSRPPPPKPPDHGTGVTATSPSDFDSVVLNCCSRSTSPASQASSYLRRVRTGEVRKLKDQFERQFHCQLEKNHSGRRHILRKVRSEPEINTFEANVKDTPPQLSTLSSGNRKGEVSWLTHKFELWNQCSKSSGGRSRAQKLLSPLSARKDRLMPHIDVISKSALLNGRGILVENPVSKSPSPCRSTVRNERGATVKRTRSIYEKCSQLSALNAVKKSCSNPDIRQWRDISPHLKAIWIAHKYPSPTDNTLSADLSKDGERQKQSRSRSKCVRKRPKTLLESNATSPIVQSKLTKAAVQHRIGKTSSTLKPPETFQRLGKDKEDFFANQNFDPSKHRPKARYVPGAEHKSCKDSKLKGGVTAVKFQDVAPTASPPPPPTPEKSVSLEECGHRAQESPNRYFESDVNIHYKTPVRYEYKDPIAEEELAMRQAEQMQKLYQEERRRKYLQELQDMNSRRHADNFTPSQKSPIPLNRYEDFQADLAPKTPSPAMSPRTVARALYNFQGQTARELSFRKGDVIYIRRKIDKNWYEGEHNAMIGLLPASYVELITKDGVRQPPRRTSEGQARAKYNFQAQSGIELSLNKGELVTLTRRVDDNWFEGKIANRKGIFPVSYVEILSDIGSKDYSTPRAVMNQRPSLETLRANVNDELNAITQNGHHTPNGILRDTRNTPTTDMLHVDTSTNPLSFRALYKYRPQNSDELELQEGDIVHVLEKCDDGWFVGTSQRTGYFGTFPGNYVERV